MKIKLQIKQQTKHRAENMNSTKLTLWAALEPTQNEKLLNKKWSKN